MKALKLNNSNGLKKSNSITKIKNMNVSPQISTKDNSVNKSKEGLSKKYESKLLSPSKTSTNFIKSNISEVKDLTPNRLKNNKVKTLTSGNIIIKRDDSKTKLGISRNNSKKSLIDEKKDSNDLNNGLKNDKSKSILLESNEIQNFNKDSNSRINILEELHREFLN